MAEIEELEGGGGAAAEGMGAGVDVPDAPDDATNAVPNGGIGGGGGAPEPFVFAFSAEQVQGAIGEADAELKVQTADLDVNLIPIQRIGVYQYVKLYATTVATKLAAHVQVLCCCVCICAKIAGCVARALECVVRALCMHCV